MLSVRSLLIEPKAQSQPQVRHAPQKQRPSVLNISSLLNDQEDSYVHIMLSRQQRQPQQPQQPQPHHYTHYHHHPPASYIRRLPPTSPQPYYSIDKRQRRSSRQHQIESRKIEQELLTERRQSSSSSSSSTYSFTGTKSQDVVDEDDEDEDDLPLKAKRRRASSKQLDVLNKVFERTFFPSTQLRAELGRQLGMSPRTVQIWFQNRRQAIRTRERSSSSRENSTSPE